MKSTRLFTTTMLAAVTACAFVLPAAQAQQAATGPGVTAAKEPKPNIVLVLMDNLGWGELGVYGGGVLRGAATPRIDKLAAEGTRLLNFNVEAQCTPSRACLLTGRYAVRTGNGSVPIDTPLYGLVQWEYTMAEMLSDAGYATGMFGKWHLGHTEGRMPVDQGFDEWFGIPNSTDESFWPDNPLFDPKSDPYAKLENIMQGRKGGRVENLRVYDAKERVLIDKELTDRTIDFMKRQKSAGKPFFAFVPYTQPHMPTLPDPEFKGKSGNGNFADVLMQIDSYVGRLLDTVDDLGLRDNTIFIFTSDNGPEFSRAWFGFSGPWRGTYFTGLEASLRVPFIVRWPGKVPAGAVNNEIMHEMDLFPTLARLAGGNVPTDRVIDGVDQTEFLLGKQEKSNRDSVVVYVGNDIHGVKWRNWKMMFKEMDIGDGPVREYSIPHFYNLLLDPKEEYPSAPNVPENLWVRFPASKVLADHAASLQKEPPIRPGTPDPYVPKR
jgi:arylsulfatase A-like enzyme